MTRRPKFVIRKQKPEHVRSGSAKQQWCAACQSCGRAAIADSRAEVMGWTGRHRCISISPVPGGVITTSRFEQVPGDLWAVRMWRTG
jgi:hypothetical protein